MKPRFATGLLLLIFSGLAWSQRGTGADNRPNPPFRIADGLYYVGSSGISSYLITTPQGHILIDAGYEQTVPIIQANLSKLGFRIQDVKILLNTQAHFDHAEGFARMKQLSGAKLFASEQDAEIIEHGGKGDFYFGDRETFSAATVDRRLKDGDEVRLGNVLLVAHLTPGHTKGCTTWTFDVKDRGRNYHAVDLCGLSILDGTRVSGMATYPEIARDYDRSYRVLKSLPCDIFLGAHPAYYDGVAKAAKLQANPEGPNPFVDPEGYRQFLAQAERRFREQLAREGGADAAKK
jgi:metallo-beta-lactamase class B